MSEPQLVPIFSVHKEEVLECECGCNLFTRNKPDIKFLEEMFDYWISTEWKCHKCFRVHETCIYISTQPPLLTLGVS